MIRNLLIAAFLTAPAIAEDTTPEGHSHHGHVFNEGPRQAAYLMPNNGSVDFPVSTVRPGVQAMFDQGIGQLHGFWYFEAERSFRQVSAIDNTCAMAYWGMSMCNVDNEDRAADFAREAWLRRDWATHRECLYIDASARFYDVDYPEPEEGEDEYERDPDDNKDRWRRLLRDYDTIIFEYPGDIEAKAFVVNLSWLASRKGVPIGTRQANQALLDDVFEAQPMHPAHHYRIHLWDQDENAQYAVDSALAAGPSWPTVAHQWHMGGHIFAKLHRHADAAWQQEASARVDHAHMMRDLVLPDQIHNYAHNNEWLVRSYALCGRVHDSIDLARNMVELPRHPEWNTLDGWGTSAAFGRRHLFSTLERYELWAELIELARTMYLEPSEEAGDEAYRAYLLGKAHAFLGHGAAMRAEIANLNALLDAERVARVESMEAAEADALAEDKDRGQIRDAMTEAIKEHERTFEDLRDKIDVLETLGRVLDGEDGEGDLETLRDARFDRQMLSRLHLAAGDVEKAVDMARDARREGEARSIANLAFVLEQAGEGEDALEAFEELRALSARFDLDVPVFARLDELAERAGYDADWRVPFELPHDIESRIELDTLGPRRWSPPIAPSWACLDANGESVTLADQDGPTIVVLFLGFGCVHCVEQLQAIAPEYEKFQSAGIDIVAIGTETVESLASAGEDAYPFAVLADPDGAVFHAYRSYDDFEDMPLHGTFLIDESGRIRWQDISYEPFTEIDFLLAESKRLLGLPVADASAGPSAVIGRTP